ncbi:MAG TPA: PIN domain protein [Ignavibacteria bacterium]|nr:PIN domain protein [Ignavibacteria bacterium]
MIARVYIDTSVIGGCFDDEFREWSNLLMDEISKGKKIAVVSDITYREIELAPEFVQQKLFNLPGDFVENITTDDETEFLAGQYVKLKAVTRKYYEDALHIANATIKKVDVVASWNFRHLVNLDRIRKYNAVNLKEGYSLVEIRTPREIIG